MSFLIESPPLLPTKQLPIRFRQPLGGLICILLPIVTSEDTADREKRQKDTRHQAEFALCAVEPIAYKQGEGWEYTKLVDWKAKDC